MISGVGSIAAPPPRPLLRETKEGEDEPPPHGRGSFRGCRVEMAADPLSWAKFVQRDRELGDRYGRSNLQHVRGWLRTDRVRDEGTTLVSLARGFAVGG